MPRGYPYKYIFLISGAALLVLLVTLLSFHIRQEFYFGLNILENYVVKDGDKKGPFELSEIEKFFDYGENYDFKKSLHKIVQLDSNSIGLVVHGWIEDLHDSQIVYDENDRDKLSEAIKLAHAAGLRVFLRPAINLRKNDGPRWRGQLSPGGFGDQSDWDTWWKSYSNFISYYFEIAKQNRIEGFFTGVELATSMQHLSQWNLILERQRRELIDHGHKMAIIYQSSAFKAGDIAPGRLKPAEMWQLFERATKQNDAEALRFLSNLDYLGVSLYETLADYSHPDFGYLEGLKKLSEFADSVDKQLLSVNQRLKEIGSDRELSIIISEFGIKSSVNGLFQPWRYATDHDEVDNDVQMRGYQAFFDVIPHRSWFKGVLFWNMHVDPYYGIANFIGRDHIRNGISDFAINGKPVEALIAKNFSSWSGHLVPKIYTHLLLYLGYLFAIAVVTVFGLHRLFLVRRAREEVRSLPKLQASELPTVTIQIPLYNEAQVAERIIESILQIDYPDSRLQIQILDDSTDETSEIVKEALLRPARQRSCEIAHIRREQRTGYKAGALAHGLLSASGDFIAIFDADFVPHSSFLKDVIPYFADERVGLVQTTWDFINSKFNLLTRIQEVYLDGHFHVEHRARANAEVFFNFNGTAGVFRKECIIDSGGWQSDFLTEDLDLSYRAQIRGWRFVYLPQIHTPSELPSSMLSFKAQQHRWTKGSAQVLRNIFWKVSTAKISWRLKREAYFHLACNIVYPCMLIMALTLYPSINIRLFYLWKHSLYIDLPVFVFGMWALISFYAFARRRAKRSLWDLFITLPAAMALGIGLSVNNTRAFFEGLFGIDSPFVRTPKSGVSSTDSQVVVLQKTKRMVRYLSIPDVVMVGIEVALAVYMLMTLKLAIEYHLWASVPFVLLFALGFIYMAALSIVETFKVLSRASKVD